MIGESWHRATNRRESREMLERLSHSELVIPDNTRPRRTAAIVAKQMRKFYGDHLFFTEKQGELQISGALVPSLSRPGQWSLRFFIFDLRTLKEHTYLSFWISAHAAARIRQAKLNRAKFVQWMLDNSNDDERQLTPWGELRFAKNGDEEAPTLTTFVPWSAMSPARAEKLKAKIWRST